MGSISGSSKEVNPTFSLKKAPVAKPASSTQVNPTFSAKKPTPKGPVSKTRVNPTFSVAHAESETTKGKSGRKLVAAKRTIGNPIATKANPTPGKAVRTMKNNGVTSKLFAIPHRNTKGTVGKGKASDAKAGKAHTAKAPHDVSVPVRNTSAPYGPNAKKSAPMTTARLKRLGY